MKILFLSLILVHFALVFACGERNDDIDDFGYGFATDETDYLKSFKELLELKWPNNKTMNIVFHGHSVPSGYFRTPVVNTLEAYPQLFLRYLKDRYPHAVINSITTSIGGENAQQGAERFKEDVLVMKPDVLFIDYALNDRGISLEAAEKAWRQMIEDALKVDVKTILFTPTPDLREDILDEAAPLDRYARMIRKLGKEYDIPVVDSYRHFQNLKEAGSELSQYMAQNNHPNALGHMEVLNVMASTLFKRSLLDD